MIIPRNTIMKCKEAIEKYKDRTCIVFCKRRGLYLTQFGFVANREVDGDMFTLKDALVKTADYTEASDIQFIFPSKLGDFKFDIKEVDEEDVYNNPHIHWKY